MVPPPPRRGDKCECGRMDGKSIICAEQGFQNAFCKRTLHITCLLFDPLFLHIAILQVDTCNIVSSKAVFPTSGLSLQL